MTTLEHSQLVQPLPRQLIPGSKDMKKEKMLLIAAVSLGGIFFLLAAVLLYGSVSKFHDLETELGGKKDKLNSYYSEDPFPSRENVKAENANVLTAVHWSNELIKKLSDSNITSTDSSPSLFKRRLGITGSILRKKALNRNTALPENFSFGFSAYSQEKRPNPDDVPRLTEQLRITKKLCEILLTNRVKSITSIARDEFEKSQSRNNATSPVRTERRRRSSRSRSRTPDPVQSSPERSVSDAGIIKEGKLHTKYHFALDFIGSSFCLLGILNDLASSDMFAVVTSVKVRKDIPELLPEEESKVDEVEIDTNKPLLHAPEKPVQIRVCGPEMELPIDIHIEVNVYKFREEITGGKS